MPRFPGCRVHALITEFLELLFGRNAPFMYVNHARELIAAVTITTCNVVYHEDLQQPCTDAQYPRGTAAITLAWVSFPGGTTDDALHRRISIRPLAVQWHGNSTHVYQRNCVANDA